MQIKMRTGYFVRGNERRQSADKVRDCRSKDCTYKIRHLNKIRFHYILYTFFFVQQSLEWDAHMVYVDGALFVIHDFHKSADCSAAFACSI